MDDTITKLNEIEKEFDDLYRTYNENMPSYVLDNLYYRLETVSYKYLNVGFSILDEEEIKSVAALIKMGLTILSYGLTTTAMFVTKNIPFVITALGSCITLSIKRRVDNTTNPFLEEDYINEICKAVENFRLKASTALDKIANRINELNSDEYINSLPERDQNYRLASKTLMSMIYHEQDNYIVNEDLKNEMVNLLNKNFNTNEEDLGKLITMELTEVEEIADVHDEYEKLTCKYMKKRYKHI